MFYGEARFEKRRRSAGGRRLVVAKLSQALGLDDTVFGPLSRTDQSIRRQPTKALDRITLIEDHASGHGNLRQRAGMMRGSKLAVTARDNCGPCSRADGTARTQRI
jgi:hypothetical protein